MKSGNLNFLEPSGALQACNGTALPLPIHCPLVSRKLFLIHVCVCVCERADICSYSNGDSIKLKIGSLNFSLSEKMKGTRRRVALCHQ